MDDRPDKSTPENADSTESNTENAGNISKTEKDVREWISTASTYLAIFGTLIVFARMVNSGVSMWIAIPVGIVMPATLLWFSAKMDSSSSDKEASDATTGFLMVAGVKFAIVGIIIAIMFVFGWW